MNDTNNTQEEHLNLSTGKTPTTYICSFNKKRFKCITQLQKYFHPQNYKLKDRFKVIYEIFNINDKILSSEIGIDTSTMCRYRTGVFIPTSQMKLKIAQAITKLASYPIDSSVIWGEDLIFSEWKKKR